jgi:D-glycero-alpha-D-manno-heptose 1-phosphate guanylyltransferase
MAPVAGRPFLEIVLRSLAIRNFTRVILAVGHKAEIIQNYFGNEYAGMVIDYALEKQPLGTGGATRLALSRCKTDHVFIFNGDTYLALEIDQIESCWQQYHEPIVVACNAADTKRYGRLGTSDGLVTHFLEKGISGPGLINAGCYVFPCSLLDAYPVGQPFSLETDFLAPQTTILKQKFHLFVTQGPFIDIGVPEDYARAQVELADVVR